MKSAMKKRFGGLFGSRPTASDTPLREVFRRFRRNKVAVAGLIVFLLICFACIFAPFITRWEYFEVNVPRRLEGPSADYILGTDALGRDIFSRLLYGGRITLRIALVSTVAAAVIGGIMGLAAGYFGRRADSFISPVLDAIASIPVILLAVVIESVFGWARGYFMYAIIIAAIPQFARLVRASVMNIIGSEYIEAAKALGVSHFGIIYRHVLHNVAPQFIVRFTGGLAESLLTCTIMGYLDIGITPPMPEWGVMVYLSRSYVFSTPLSMIIPCAVISICVISIGLFGDGLRDALDPKEITMQE